MQPELSGAHFLRWTEPWQKIAGTERGLSCPNNSRFISTNMLRLRLFLKWLIFMLPIFRDFVSCQKWFDKLIQRRFSMDD